jgi:hypothetical protein
MEEPRCCGLGRRRERSWFRFGLGPGVAKVRVSMYCNTASGCIWMHEDSSGHRIESEIGIGWEGY